MQTQILQYHVIPSEAKAADLIAALDGEEADLPATLQGEAIKGSMFGDKVKLDGSSTVTATDVMTSNGVVHLVSSVPFPLLNRMSLRTSSSNAFVVLRYSDG